MAREIDKWGSYLKTSTSILYPPLNNGFLKTDVSDDILFIKMPSCIF